jgi:hypothetical protein
MAVRKRDQSEVPPSRIRKGASLDNLSAKARIVRNQEVEVTVRNFRCPPAALKKQPGGGDFRLGAPVDAHHTEGSAKHIKASCEVLHVLIDCAGHVVVCINESHEVFAKSLANARHTSKKPLSYPPATPASFIPFHSPSTCRSGSRVSTIRFPLQEQRRMSIESDRHPDVDPQSNSKAAGIHELGGRYSCQTEPFCALWHPACRQAHHAWQSSFQFSEKMQT